jgi:hypothetical protein
VTFYDGASVLGTGTVGTAHTATFRPASGAAFWGGTHSLTAEYGGTSTYAASISPAFTQTVTKGTVTITLDGGKNTGTVGSNFAFAAVLAPSQTNATYAPNQSQVNFYSDGTLIGSATPLTITSSQGGYGLWTATITTTALTAGTHAITATYGDVNYTTNTSAAFNVTVTGSAATMATPANGSTLSGAATTFTWNTNGSSGPYYIWVGSTPGGLDLGNAGVASGTSMTLTLPTTGAKLYVTLWSTLNGSQVSTTATYTEASLLPATMSTPSSGSTLSGAATTFTWNANASVGPFYIWVGSTPGGLDLGNAGVASGSSMTLNLPTNGNTIYVTLWSTLNGNQVSKSYTYTEATMLPATMSTPTNGSTLTGPATTFTWSSNGSTGPFYIWVGSTPGGLDLGNAGVASGSSMTLNLPTTGATVYVTLWSTLNGNLVSNNYSYTEATQVPAAISSPASGSSVSGSTTFTWNPNASVGPYYIWVGSTPGGLDLGNAGVVSDTSMTLVLPTDGNPVYVTLWSMLNGSQVSTAAAYNGGVLPSVKKPVVPANKSTMTLAPKAKK